MEVFLCVFGIAVGFIVYFWAVFNLNKATNEDLEMLIVKAGNNSEAKKIIVSCMKNKKLQKRHCGIALQKIIEIIDREEANSMVAEFKADITKH